MFVWHFGSALAFMPDSRTIEPLIADLGHTHTMRSIGDETKTRYDG